MNMHAVSITVIDLYPKSCSSRSHIANIWMNPSYIGPAKGPLLGMLPQLRMLRQKVITAIHG